MTTDVLATKEHIDQVNLPIFWNRLSSISDEMASTLRRTSFSTVVSAANDFGCQLLDASGDSVVHSARSMPAFNQTMPTAVKAMLARFTDDIRPGDVFATNDPWLCAGHLGDIVIASPIYYRDRLTGFAVNMAHHADIGGTLSVTGSREVFEEGLRLPPCLVRRDGALQQAIVDIVAANVRVPDLVIGDLQAQIATNDLGLRRVVEMLDEFQLSSLDTLGHAIQQHSERQMRDAIAALPDGVYVAELETQGVYHPIRLRVAVTVAGDEMVVDYAGTDPQLVRGSANVTFNMTRAKTTYVLSYLLVPDVPNNDGCYRPISVVAPEGCILNARFPAAVNIRTRVSNFIAPLLNRALARAIPDKIHADCGMRCAMVSNGIDTIRGERFNAWVFAGGGLGARAHGDGVPCRLFPTSASAVPVEIVEARSPFLITHKRLVPNSGGAGQYRGGLGQEIGLRLRDGQTQPVVLSVWPDMLRFPARGLFGGRPGTRSAVIVNGRALKASSPAILAGSLEVRPGDQVVIRTPGGAGFGPPGKRAKAAVARDEEWGYVTHDPQRVKIRRKE